MTHTFFRKKLKIFTFPKCAIIKTDRQTEVYPQQKCCAQALCFVVPRGYRRPPSHYRYSLFLFGCDQNELRGLVTAGFNTVRYCPDHSTNASLNSFWSHSSYFALLQ